MFQILVGILCGIGFYFILADVLRVPYMKTSMAALNLTRSQKANTTILDVWLGGLAEKLSKFIRIDEFKKADLEVNLRTAQMDITAERYVADAAVRGVLMGGLLCMLFFVNRYMLLVGIVAGIFIYFREINKVARGMRVIREAIEYELPALVFNIEKTLKHNRDLIAMLSTYESIAGPAMRREIEITLADMRSGNYETAITRFEVRVGSPLVSDVCRGLISILRGDNTEGYWTLLSAKFSEIQRAQLRAKAKKIPPKVHRLSIALMLAFVLEYVVAIGYQLITSLSTLFAAA